MRACPFHDGGVGRRKIRPAAGFTLIEIMIVVGIAVLVMAISIPFVQRTIRHDAVVVAVKVVEDACHNARALAIFGNGPSELLIRPLDGMFSVNASAPAAAGGPRMMERDGSAPRKAAGPQLKPYSGSLGDDVVIELLDVNFQEHHSDEETRIRFHPNGTSDEFTIVLRIGSRAWRKVTLDIMTGLPKTEIIR